MSTRREFLLRAGVALATPVLSCRREKSSGEPTATGIGQTERSPNMSVQLSRVMPTVSKSIGSIFSVNSLELTSERSSPTVVVDDFRVSGRPFGPHPHAGFSAITYVFRDSATSLRSRDSLGAHVVVGPGGICWLQAGSGAQHEEIPAERGKELHGLQVFVNLSAKNKFTPPGTLSLPSDQVPVWTNASGGDRVRVAVGSFEGVSSPLQPIEPFTFLDVELHHEIDLKLGDAHNAVIYARTGSAFVQADGREQRLSGGQGLVAFGGPGTVKLRSSSRADLMILSGAEIRERLIVEGPFMMNEPSQIEEAAERYRSGRMGHLAPFVEG